MFYRYNFYFRWNDVFKNGAHGGDRKQQLSTHMISLCNKQAGAAVVEGFAEAEGASLR